MNTELFARNLRAIRKARGISQTEVAKRLFVTPQTVSKWENGNALPDVTNLCHLSELLQTTPNRLLGVGEAHDRVFLGIDSGGTKTDVVLFREDGTVLRRKIFPGANPNACGMERALEILCHAIEETCSEHTPCGIFAGVAGCVAADNKTKMLSVLKKRFAGIPLSLESDIENVIGSVRGADRCVAAISGTGTVTYAWDGTTLHRLGGYGYLFDGAGSGYDIGRDVLTACFEADDGLRAPSIMTDLATQKLGGRAWDKLDLLYREGKNTIAAFAPIAFEAAKKGDKTAEEILRHNFARIAKLILHAQKTFDCANTVICAGSIAATEEFRTILKEWGIDPIIPHMPPVYGACVKCTQHYAKTDAETFDRNFNHTLPN